MTNGNLTPEQEMAARTRRSFLTLGLGTAAALGGYSWLRSQPLEDELEWPLRRVLQMNEKLASAYFSGGHPARQFPPSAVVPEPRVNGNIGMEGEDFRPADWKLMVGNRQITLAELESLPKVEQITELNCIEGWTNVIHWGGVRFADFTRKFAPEWQNAKFVGMRTPDEEYFVGLDMPSAMHPQTLLALEQNGKPLTLAHGAPLRLVIPVKYGVKNIKRIGTITYSNERPEDYWAGEGYDWYAGL